MIGQTGQKYQPPPPTPTASPDAEHQYAAGEVGGEVDPDAQPGGPLLGSTAAGIVTSETVGGKVGDQLA
ncbi:hypothetical protein ATO49_04060 [Mycolicibacterium fortuitum subsp. fortuitum DSM 46621 = ATCC 6841 = JCM 6387]|nr:hypothetical protein ATO49_04060 [Mycolicibacterium fortuitum subsp. fortuitum DSM 46621 = ATCC 6841 = JCM 6387]